MGLFEAVIYYSRDIDIKGWYKNNHIIGIIYIGADATTNEIIIDRIRYHFSCTISAEIAKALSISSLIFPDEIMSDIWENESIHAKIQ